MTACDSVTPVSPFRGRPGHLADRVFRPRLGVPTAQWHAIDSYRLRQIPEMGLAATLLALGTIALADTTGNGKTAIQIASGAALLFSIWHMLDLTQRWRRIAGVQGVQRWIAVGSLDLLVLVFGALSLGLGVTSVYEWLLISMLARPMLAFVLVLTDVAEG